MPYPPRETAGSCRYSQLRQLFQNLISNGIKFHKTGIKPVVSIYCDSAKPSLLDDPKKKCCIVIEDNGIGFPEEYSHNVFQLFNKLDNVGPSLGIGLPLVKKIVRNHSGEVRVNSKPGTGTRFEIELPVKVKD